MSDNEWNSLLCNTDLGDLAEFVSCLLGGDSVNGKSTFDVVDKTESFVSFFDGDDIHETGWEGNVTSNFTVNFDQVLLQNFLHFIPGKGIMETISEEDDQWEALPLLVWTLGWFGCENSCEFVEHPSRGSSLLFCSGRFLRDYFFISFNSSSFIGFGRSGFLSCHRWSSFISCWLILPFPASRD